MGKFLLFVAAVWVAWWYFRKVKAAKKAAEPPAERSPERMVVCAHCGVHLPESESVAQDQLHYCSQEHLRLGPGK